MDKKCTFDPLAVYITYIRTLKKVICIFILHAYLFAATDLKEVLKAEILLEHYFETRQQDASVSFFSFIIMHYITDDHNDKDNDRDVKLPFKSHHVQSNFTPFTYLPPRLSFLKIITFSPMRSFLFFNDNDYAVNFYSLVWHPPQA